ncbi:WXG100 family type VII secretion target [Actinoplanes sp. CA-054009]
MSDFGFSFSVADATLFDMNKANNEIHSELTTLEQTVEGALRDQWKGGAFAEYEAAKAKWNAAAAEMNGYLEQARVTFGQISENYGMTESQVSKLWNNVRGD